MTLWPAGPPMLSVCLKCPERSLNLVSLVAERQYGVRAAEATRRATKNVAPPVDEVGYGPTLSGPAMNAGEFRHAKELTGTRLSEHLSHNASLA